VTSLERHISHHGLAHTGGGCNSFRDRVGVFADVTRGMRQLSFAYSSQYSRAVSAT